MTAPNVLALILLSSGAAALPPLRLRSDGSFTIVQIADVHTGEGEGSWGPKVDNKTYSVLADLLRIEHPDLAVLTGDMITGLNVDANATVYWDRLVGVFDRAGVPHTAILGNHDAEPFSGSGKNQSSPGAKTNRTRLIQHDQRLRMSHTQLGPSSLQPAVSVYVVDVLPSQGQSGSRPALQLVHLDSGGGGMPEELSTEQVVWFNDTMRARRSKWGDVPTLVFVHIPLWEYQDALNGGDQCFGDADDGITPTISNTGLFAALEAAPEVMAVFVGHDHCNDFCCKWGSQTHKVDLCFGHHSGYGGYDCPSAYDHGSRVITFQQNQRPQLITHVRMVNASITHPGILKY